MDLVYPSGSGGSNENYVRKYYFIIQRSNQSMAYYSIWILEDGKLIDFKNGAGNYYDGYLYIKNMSGSPCRIQPWTPATYKMVSGGIVRNTNLSAVTSSSSVDDCEIVAENGEVYGSESYWNASESNGLTPYTFCIGSVYFI